MKGLSFAILILILLLGCVEEGVDVGEQGLNLSQPVDDEHPLPEEQRFVDRRRDMVEQQLAGRDITDEKVLQAMGAVQRHRFVPDNVVEHVYEDRPLPIGFGQTISQPYIVALMTQELEIKEGEKVLEIGTGSGYQAAVLAELTDRVYTIEIIEELSQSAREHLVENGYDYVEVKNADGYFGWNEYAPFDAVIITAAVDHVPRPLIEQLRDGGRLILPLESTRQWQTLILVRKRGEDLESRYITGVRFVPMTGEARRGD